MDMYKVLLVDDEILIRERISKRIPWEELGYELVGTCENGEEAVELIKDQKIDLILTDICMPYMDGLELAKYVYEHVRNIKVVIITGYDEFEYAKNAMEYRVFSYILKPVTAAELIRSLKDVHKVLEEEFTNLQARFRYEDSYLLLKNQFLIQLAQGMSDEGTLAEKLHEFQIKFQGDYYCTVVLYPKNPMNKLDVERVIQLLESEFSGHILPFEGQEGAIIAYVAKHHQLKKEIGAMCQTIVFDIQEKMNIEIFCLVGTCVTSLNDVNLSYEKEGELKEYLYLEKESHVYEWEHLKRCRLNSDRNLSKDDREKRLLYAVQSNMEDEIYRDITMIRTECSEKWISKTKVVILYQSLILSVMSLFERLDFDEEAFFMKAQEIVSSLYGCDYISEMENRVLKFFRMALEIMNKNRSNYGERQAAAALEYINESYSDCSLSLNSMCGKLAISVSYFSSAFKNYTGMTFVEALTKKRMEKAMELLENTSLKSYEIAERCGYTDANYFSSIFKRAAGKTPREYMKTRKGLNKSHED